MFWGHQSVIQLPFKNQSLMRGFLEGTPSKPSMLFIRETETPARSRPTVGST